MKIEVGKTYQTQGGHAVRIICTDRKSLEGYSVIGLARFDFTDSEGPRYFTPEGKAYGHNSWDLVPRRTQFRIERWVNVYRDTDGRLYTTATWPAENDAKISAQNHPKYVGTFPAHVEGEVEE